MPLETWKNLSVDYFIRKGLWVTPIFCVNCFLHDQKKKKKQMEMEKQRESDQSQTIIRHMQMPAQRENIPHTHPSHALSAVCIWKVDPSYAVLAVPRGVWQTFSSVLRRRLRNSVTSWKMMISAALSNLAPGGSCSAGSSWIELGWWRRFRICCSDGCTSLHLWN